MKTMPSIEELASDALFSISDLYDDDALDDIENLSALEQVQLRYRSADCDDFALALNVVAGWKVVEAVSATEGPLHRLNIDDEGRFVDVMGYVTEEDLRKRYKAEDLNVIETRGHQSCLDDDHSLKQVVATIVHLPYSPFEKLAAAAEKFILDGAYFDADSNELPLKKIRP